jgi:hypothetical protein
MEKISIYDYYAFGHDYRLLLDTTESVKAEKYFKDITSYMETIKRINLNVTLTGIQLKGLELDIEKLRKLAKSTKAKTEKIPKDIFDSINKKLNQVDNILDAELNTKTAYLLNEKRHSSDILLNKIQNLFADDVFFYLTDIAQFDFKEAGTCLAFDRFTATAFHCLRATEEVLKQYYSLLLACSPKDTDTWWDYTDLIDKGTKSGTISPEPPEELMQNLNNLRKYYRNKTQHPSKIYSKDEAQDLLGMCIKTVNEMILDLEKRSSI